MSAPDTRKGDRHRGHLMSIRLLDGDYERLQAAALREGEITPTQLARRAIRSFLNDVEPTRPSTSQQRSI